MRLIGYSCRRPEPPLCSVFMPLEGLTVLLGPNDSGKSSLLRAVVRDLQGGHFAVTERDDWRYAGAVFFAEATDEELRSLISEAVEIRRRQSVNSRGTLGSRQPYFQSVAARYFDPGSEEVVDAWLATLGDSAESEGFARAAEALGASRTLALEPAGVERDRPIWNVYWCLPRRDSLAADVREALERSHVDPFKSERQRVEAKANDKFAPLRGIYPALHGVPRHLWVDGAPVVVDAIGQSETLHIPLGLTVPTTFGELRREVSNAVNELVTAARFAPDDALSDWDPPTAEQRRAREAPRNWLESGEDDLWRVHPAAGAAAAFIAAAANRTLPDFVSNKYRVEVLLRPLDMWFDGDHGPLGLRLAERRDDPIGISFPVEDAADGMQLWVQLALLQACELAAKARRQLEDVATDRADAIIEASRAHGRGDHDDDHTELAEHYDRLFESMLGELQSLIEPEQPWMDGALAERLQRSEPDDWTRRVARHRRFFVVDEPERHLHPRLQREAAVWLKRTSEEYGAPCLVATHSTPFLSLPSNDLGPLYVYVERDGRCVRCEPFDGGQLKELDSIVTSLGFDRGELLTTVSMFLVVEGIHDVVVLEEVFDELRAARIALLPMEGLANYRAVIEADALWRYTTASVGLATDKFDQATLARLVTDPQYARTLRKSDADEETKILAKLIGVAERAGKKVHLMGHRGADLIDVLDEDIIRQEYPDYPGHAAAQALWQDAQAAGARASQRKPFYEKTFKIPAQVETYMRLGKALARARRKPAALKTIVDAAVSVSRGEQPADAVSTTPN